MSEEIPTYESYEQWKKWGQVSFGVWTDMDAVYYAAEFRRAKISTLTGLRIYEIGFGNGGFAGYAISRGAEYFGSERSAVLLERARHLRWNVFENGIGQALKEMQSMSLDVVVAFDVLEHLPIDDIVAFLRDARKLLKQGGVVIARVPSGDSPFGRAIFHGDITHRTALGSAAILQLALQTGFEAVAIAAPKLPVLGVGIVRAVRRSCILVVRKLIAWVVNLVFHDGQPRVIEANLVFVLKKSG